MHRPKTRLELLVLWVVLLAGQSPLSAKDAPSPIDLARQLNQAFVEVADKVSPAVVVIQVAHKPDSGGLDAENNPFFDLLPDLKRRWEEQYKQYHQPRPDREPIFDSEGSGIVIRQDGYILTNNHVVEGADRITVRLKDGTEYADAEITGVDPQSEVAVIKIPAKGLSAAKLGDSAKTKVGEF